MDLSKFPEIKRTMISDKVAKYLLNMILQGELKSGDKLPPERILSEQLNVGRPAIREALSALHMMNVITIIQGDGTYVSSLKPDILLQPFKVLTSLGEADLTCLFEVRKILEVGIAGLAATNITEVEIETLENCYEHSLKSKMNYIEFLKVDEELHSIIIQASRNIILINIMLSIGQIARSSREITGQFPDIRSTVVNDHKKIINALKSKDAKKSKEAMEKHLENVERLYQLHLKDS